MTPTEAARWIINHYLPSGHPDKNLDFISLGGNECVFRHRDDCAVTIARAMLDAEERNAKIQNCLMDIIENDEMPIETKLKLELVLDAAHDPATGKAGG